MSDFFPKKTGQGAGGLWWSLGLLLVALLIAIGVGVVGFLALRLVVPTAPVYVAVVIGAVALVIVLQVIARRFEWIMPWYYLLPALLFLLTFTIFPVVLTIVLAFTDYAGIRNGQLNVSSASTLTNVDGNTLEVDNIRTLNCQALRNGCTDVRAIVYASGSLSVVGSSLEDGVLTLEEPVPEDRTVTAVELELPEVGFRAQFPVTSVGGNELTLERTPPGEVNLEDVRLSLDRVPLSRTMTSVEGSVITLDEPLPDGLEYESIARYNSFGWVGWRNFRTIFNQASRAL